MLEGSISITGKVGNRVIKDPILLRPNEQATLTKSQSSVDISQTIKEPSTTTESEQTITDVPKVASKTQPRFQIKEGIDVESFVSWKKNVLIFKNERFEDLAKKLERWYNVEIVINDIKLKDSRYTGTFEEETIEQAIKALSLSLPFTYEITKNKIEIIKSKSKL